MNKLDLKEINSSVEKLFEEWKKLQPLKAEHQKTLDKKTRLDWNYHSNRIEGNTLTYGETHLLLFFGRIEGGHLERDYKEMKAHDVAIQKVRDLAQSEDYPLTENDIRDLNKIILKEPFWKKTQTPDGAETKKQIIPGEYKKQPNHVKTSTGEIFHFAEPEEVSSKMKELFEWHNKELNKPTSSISTFLAELHHRFILIHPFDDGNGRVIRLWINYILLRLGYPPLVIKSEDRENYIIALNKADVGDKEALATYMGQVLIQWLDIGIRAAKGEDISEVGDVDKEVELFVKSEQQAITLLDIQPKEVLFDNFFKPFFDTLYQKFEDFDQVFSSKKICLSNHTGIIFQPDKIVSQQDISEIHSFFQKVVNSEGFRSEYKNQTISLHILYQNYKYVEADLDLVLRCGITFHKTHYVLVLKINIPVKTPLPSSIVIGQDTLSKFYKYIWNTEEITSISYKKPYSHIWKTEEITSVVSDYKKHFLNSIEEIKTELSKNK